jgi:hypothetical protein
VGEFLGLGGASRGCWTARARLRAASDPGPAFVRIVGEEEPALLSRTTRAGSPPTCRAGHCAGPEAARR